VPAKLQLSVLYSVLKRAIVLWHLKPSSIVVGYKKFEWVCDKTPIGDQPLMSLSSISVISALEDALLVELWWLSWSVALQTVCMTLTSPASICHPSLGVPTIDRIARMYGTIIQVPSTGPVVIWQCGYRNRTHSHCQPYSPVLWWPFMAVIRVLIKNFNS